ncbi:NAD(P)-dependent oxidoreductase [Streptomyces sp. NPDC059506]|uniref:NAD(P)-dependent oxidoreductase n=1 Tax=Streptomyces sp. NPDC059506 TaxID=3347751 RepID=UPI0036A3935F
MASEPLRTAVLGTGIMGAAMARNLCRAAGTRVRVWNRTRGRAEPLAGDGALVAVDPAEAVEGADVVLTVLHDGPALLDVVRQAAPALRPGTVWMQATTAGLEVLPEIAEFAREHRLLLVDAPVLGTRQPAELGRLTVLAAGPQEARERAQKVFDVIGERTLWLGEDAAGGAATRLKLVCNSWVLALNNATGETLALAEGLGVDPQAFLDAVAGGPLDNGYLRTKAAAILSGALEPPSFAVATAAKDARLIVEAARGCDVRLDLAEAGAERLRRTERQGRGGQDMAAAYYAGFES